MPAVFAAIGLVAGLLLSQGGIHWSAALLGAALGYLLGRVAELQRRVRELEIERRMEEIDEALPRVEGPAPPEAPAAEPSAVRPPAPVSPSPPPPSPPSPEPPAPESIAEPAPPVPETASRTSAAGGERPGGKAAAAPSGLDRALAAARDWLTTGNVPVKVGVLVSFFGVAFLLKYAVDRELLRFPIELRLALVAIAGIALLGLGWRLRRRSRIYALSLQGGGVGILYLTFFAAYRLYSLLPTGLTFALLVLLTAFAGALAVVESARGLAILGIVGGFLAPLLVSTGSGNHVALFSYYLMLNAAILGIAWFRAWRVLNLLGFVFTFGIATLWGHEGYRPEHFATTEPFLVAHFLFYVAVAILFARRQPPRLAGWVDGTLVFGTPVVAFALQSALLEDSEYGLAVSALAAAVLYVLLAAWLFRSRRELRLLAESFVALAVAFATLAIPLALDGRWTGAAWALEGAALVWVGGRQNRLLARLAGAGLIFAAGATFFVAVASADAPFRPYFFNAFFLGAVMIAGAAVDAARRLGGDDEPLWQKLLAVGLLLWGGAWWLLGWQIEIARAIDDEGLAVALLHLAASTLLLSWLARRWSWGIGRWATFAYLPSLGLIALILLTSEAHPVVGWGWLAWPLAWAVSFWILRAGEERTGVPLAVWHTATGVGLAALVAWEAAWRVEDAGLGDAWVAAAGGAVLALAAWSIVALRHRLRWPLARHWRSWAAAAGLLAAVELLYFSAVNVWVAGAPAPLPYIPVLNPLDLGTLLALAAAAAVLIAVRDPTAPRSDAKAGFVLLGLFAFGMTTAAVVRGVHLVAGVPWTAAELARSTSVQAALSIYWSSLAFAGMVWGARRRMRPIWIAGATLMGIVVLKLFLVDLGSTGTVARIVSFIGVGALLLVVGYFAPVPPGVSETGSDLESSS